MKKNIKEILYLSSFIVFFILSFIFYTSENNVTSIQKTRAFHNAKLNDTINHLPLLKNDTSSIIEHSNDLENFKKKKKKFLFFELLDK
tara:strand:- start:492 stop:755 length:264 start_codon:yes stop_codon:yes gene_type:complete